MKNLAIFGSSRSGKSTLAKMVAEKYPNYHIYIGDDIRWAFQETLPQVNINMYGGSGMIEDFPNFLSSLFYKSIKRNKGEINYIVETCDITPDKAKKLFNKQNTVILFLGVPNLTAQNHFEEIRKYQIEKDWTFQRSNEEILNHCKYWINESKKMQEACRKLNIWFVDTSFNRSEVLQNTFELLVNKILLED